MDRFFLLDTVRHTSSYRKSETLHSSPTAAREYRPPLESVISLSSLPLGRGYLLPAAGTSCL